MNDIDKLRSISDQGACCSQVMVYMGMEWQGIYDTMLMQIAGGLCAGLRCGLTCGALTGGILMLGMFDPSISNSVMVPELVEWFMAEYGVDGNVNCGSLKNQNENNRYDCCPNLVENTYIKAKQILLENGFEPRSLLDYGLDDQDLSVDEWDEDDFDKAMKFFSIDDLHLE